MLYLKLNNCKSLQPMNEQLLLFVTINPWKSVTDIQSTILHILEILIPMHYQMKIIFWGKCAKTSEGVPRNAFGTKIQMYFKRRRRT